MFVAILVALAVVLAWPAPRLMARTTVFRHVPRAALTAWQAVSVAAVLSALAATPAVVPQLTAMSGDPARRQAAIVVAAVVSGLMLARLLLAGHRTGTRLRSLRRRHRALVDLLDGPSPPASPAAALSMETDPGLRVLEHPTPTAYCLPGLRRRVVLSQGTIDTLPADELAAVLAHERAHLRARHDLILEFFTVVHTAMPEQVRCHEALAEVRLLVEVLADRSAVRAVGRLPVARALVALAGGTHPDAALGASGSTSLIRLDLLADEARLRPLLSAVTYLFALAVLAAPVLVVLAAWR